jgi:hypothetical protein
MSVAKMKKEHIEKIVGDLTGDGIAAFKNFIKKNLDRKYTDVFINQDGSVSVKFNEDRCLEIQNTDDVVHKYEQLITQFKSEDSKYHSLSYSRADVAALEKQAKLFKNNNLAVVEKLVDDLENINKIEINKQVNEIGYLLGGFAE